MSPDRADTPRRGQPSCSPPRIMPCLTFRGQRECPARQQSSRKSLNSKPNGVLEGGGTPTSRPPCKKFFSKVKHSNFGLDTIDTLNSATISVCCQAMRHARRDPTLMFLVGRIIKKKGASEILHYILYPFPNVLYIHL